MLDIIFYAKTLLQIILNPLHQTFVSTGQKEILSQAFDLPYSNMHPAK